MGRRGGGVEDRRGERSEGGENKEQCQGISAVGKTIDGLGERGEEGLEKRERGGKKRKADVTDMKTKGNTEGETP